MILVKKIGQLAAVAGSVYLTEKTAQNFSLFGKKKEDEQKNATMFMWGNGFYQARPDDRRQFANFVPKDITSYRNKGAENVSQADLPRFIDVRFADTFGVGVTKAGAIYSFENRDIPAYKDKNDTTNFVKQGDKTFDKDNMLVGLQNLNLSTKAIKIGMTKDFVWALDEKGNLHQMHISKIKDEKFTGEWRKITTIDKVQDISTGRDHILMLKKNGELFSMGDDTFGQCGIGSNGRLRGGPFAESRLPNPTKIAALEGRAVDKIFSNGDHNMVLLKSKELLGFGSNSLLQLGHADQYMQQKNPAMAFFEPISFSGYLDTVKCDLQEVALGSDFSVFVCKNKETGNTQLFGCGHNIYGQLGNGFINHTSDFQFMDTLSDFTVPTADFKQAPVDVKQISCGKGHCMALMSMGVVMIWGMNDYGQLGNRKRAFKETPLIVSRLKNQDVVKVVADNNNSYVLVNDFKETGEKVQSDK